MQSKTDKISGLTTFLWWCSGAEVEALKRFPSEKTKYTLIGASIFLMALFAIFSGAYVFSVVFDSKVLGTLFAVMWGIFVFIIEKFTSAIVLKATTVSRKLVQLFPGILINIVLTLIISVPLNLKIFEKEILTTYQRQTVEQTSNVIKDLTIQKVQLDSQFKETNDEFEFQANYTNQLFDDYIREVKGVGSSGLAGLGLAAKYREERYNDARDRLKKIQLQRDSLVSQTQKMSAIITEQINKATHQKLYPVTFFRMYQIFVRLRRENSTMNMMSVMISALILLFSIQPTSVQLLSTRGSYNDYVSMRDEVDLAEYSFLTRNKEHSARKALELDEQAHLTDKKSESEQSESSSRNKEPSPPNGFLLHLSTMLDNFSNEAVINEKKAKSLFIYGIIFCVFGIMTAFGFLVFWLNYFSLNKFESYHLFALASGTVTIIIIEFLGAWFLKHHKIVSARSLHILFSKSVIDRYLLMYRAIIDIGGKENQAIYLNQLLTTLDKDLKFPKATSADSSDFANDASSSISNLLKQVK